MLTEWLLRRLGRERAARALAPEGWILVSEQDLLDLFLCSIRYAQFIQTPSANYIVPQIALRYCDFFSDWKRVLIREEARKATVAAEPERRAWWFALLDALDGRAS